MNIGDIVGDARTLIEAKPASSTPKAAPINPQLTANSESLRRMMTLALFGAGIVCTLGAVGMVLIVWLGGWEPATAPQRLEILGWALLGMLAGVITVIVSLAIGGPVGRLHGAFGLASFDASAAGGDATVAQVTTTTTVGPPAASPPPVTSSDAG